MMTVINTAIHTVYTSRETRWNTQMSVNGKPLYLGMQAKLSYCGAQRYPKIPKDIQGLILDKGSAFYSLCCSP